MKENETHFYIKSKAPNGNASKRNYKIYEKIDTKKNIKSIIEEDITNFKNPSNSIQYIENQILLDYIISEKYKNNKTIYDDEYIYEKYNKNQGLENLLPYISLETLLPFYKSKNIYYDYNINNKLYAHLNKYYYSENIFKKKIRIRLEVGENILKDHKKIEYIIEKIIEKISSVTHIPNEDLYVVNVRKNCLLFDIFYAIKKKIGDVFKYIIGKIEDKFVTHREEFIQFLRNIVNDVDRDNNNINIINNINNNNYYEDHPVVVELRNILDHFIIPNMNIFYFSFFDDKYDKRRGSFGRILWLFHIDRVVKNGRIYYYPNINCEGYGLRVNRIIDGEDIFDPSGDYCIVFTTLNRDQIHYKIDEFRGGIIEKRNNDETFKLFRLFLQCKIKRENIRWGDGNNLICENGLLIPYRIIKENLN